jgi:hypothetical protein
LSANAVAIPGIPKESKFAKYFDFSQEAVLAM